MQNKKCLKNKIFLPRHSSVKWNDPVNFLGLIRNFRCQKYVKKGYMEMAKKIFLETLKSVLGCSILHYCFEPCFGLKARNSLVV